MVSWYCLDNHLGSGALGHTLRTTGLDDNEVLQKPNKVKKKSNLCCPHFTVGETEAQSGEIPLCPTFHSWSGAGLRLKPRRSASSLASGSYPVPPLSKMTPLSPKARAFPTCWGGRGRGTLEGKREQQVDREWLRQEQGQTDLPP